MDLWGLAVGDLALIAVALTGGILALVRARRLRTAPTALAAAACVVLLVAAIVDLVWWMVVVRTVLNGGDLDRFSPMSNAGLFTTSVLISIGIGLLLVAVHIDRPVLPARTAAAVPGPVFPATPAGARAAAAGPGRRGEPPDDNPPPAPPAEWGAMSGVWSISSGTPDEPPQSPPPRS